MMWFKNVSTHAKLAVGSITMWILLVIVLITSYIGFIEITKSEKDLYDLHFKEAVDFLLLRSNTNYNRGQILEMILNTDSSEKNEIIANINERVKRMDKIIEGLQKLDHDPQFRSRIEELKNIIAAYRAIREQEIALIEKGKIEEARQLTIKLQDERYEKIYSIVTELGDKALADIGQQVITDIQTAGRIKSFFLIMGIATVILSGLIIIFALYSIEQEKKRIEDEGKRFEEEKRYRAIFEGAAEGIMIIEHHTRDIKYVNPAICWMLGYNEDELIHLTVNDILPASILDQVGSDFEAHDQENKTMFLKDLECLKKDGTIIYADVVITPRIIIDGRAHSVDFFMDVTKRRKAEDEKKKMETQLLQSQKLEAVGRLTGGIAHDFNNIMTTIIGNADIMLSMLPKGDPMREGLEEIRDAGERASGLVSQLLAFSRKQVLQPTIMSLNETVRDMDRMLRRIIGEDIELSAILAPDLGLVEADQGQMEQVIMNLVVNARDAMPRGGKITIETVNVELDEVYASSHISVIPGTYVMMSVNDTGVGMTKEVQEHVFEPFFTTKDIGKGTGLGLSTVYGIVKQSKGNIWVYSELEKGTTFKVYLPRTERVISEKEKKDKKEGALTGSETILIVEDDEMVRKFAEKVLKRYGYRVLISSNGEEAIRIAGEYEGPIDLMLMDVVMPGMSGQEIEERLRTSRPDIKVLYMSGYTDDAIVHHGILDKGKMFLQKPFTVNALGRKVREALRD